MRFDTLLAHPWFHTWLAALIAIVAATVAHRIAQAVLSRIARPMPLVHAMVNAVRNPAGFVLPLIALQGVWQAAPDDLHFIDRVRHLNGLLLIACMTWAVVRLIRGFAEGVIAAHPVDVEDNMNARRILTQTRVIARSAMSIAVVLGAAMMLMTFPGAKQVGASLLASAGVIGIVGGLAAKPVFSNLIAGLQIALAQPIRIDDVLVVQGEWGRVEEITSTYVVLAIWDKRRLIIPLQWFIENPFANWTHTTSQIIGTVFVWVDFSTPLEPLRAELTRILKDAKEWDGQVSVLQVTDWNTSAVQLRALCSAPDSGRSWDLCCKVREGLLSYLQREHPDSLPRLRIADTPTAAPAPPAPSAKAVTSPTP